MALTPFSLLLRSPEEAGPAHCSAEGLPACPREWLPLGEPSRAHRPRAAPVLPVGHVTLPAAGTLSLASGVTVFMGRGDPYQVGWPSLGKVSMFPLLGTWGVVGCSGSAGLVLGGLAWLRLRSKEWTWGHHGDMGTALQGTEAVTRTLLEADRPRLLSGHSHWWVASVGTS